MPKIGEVVTYVDQYAKEHKALLTNVFGPEETPSAVNLVYVVAEELQTDQYGRQTKRETSVVNKISQSAHGRYWYN